MGKAALGGWGRRPGVGWGGDRLLGQREEGGAVGGQGGNGMQVGPSPVRGFLMITYIALFSALLSRLTAFACGST